MTAHWNHPTDDAVEHYSLHKLSGSDLDAFEEHLLICEPCQERVRQADEFTSAMRTAATSLRAKERRKEKLDGARSAWLVRMPVWAGGFALCLLFLVFWMPFRSGTVGPQATIALAATRGAESGSVVRVPENRPLLLAIASQDLPPDLSRLEWELVRETGAPLAKGVAAVKNQGLSIPISSPLAPGSYWLRLYDPRQTDSLIREYGLRAGK